MKKRWQRKMKFEIINPSDKCFMEADDFKTACVCNVILGEGYYGLQEVDGINTMPPIKFATGWFLDTFKQNIMDAIKELKPEDAIKVFSSVRLAYEEPSSLNDIVGRAKALAEYLKKNTVVKR